MPEPHGASFLADSPSPGASVLGLDDLRARRPQAWELRSIGPAPSSRRSRRELSADGSFFLLLRRSGARADSGGRIMEA